jgi:predicted porin
MKPDSHAAVAAATLCAIFSILSGAVRAQPESGAWEYEIVPYLWAANLDGRSGLKPAVGDVEQDFGDLIEFVNIGGSLHFEARRTPISWYLEASYVELESTGGSPATGGVRLELGQTYGEGGLRYDINDQLAIYGGIRYQRLDTEIDSVLLGSARGNQDWIDGLAGARWMPIRSPTWLAWVRADAGAGGSDLTWLAEAGAGYRFGSRWGAYVVYRVLDTDYESGRFVYDMRQSGLAFGFGLRF